MFRPTCTKGRCTPGTSRSSASCGARFTAEVAYVGNRGHDVIATFNMNAGMVLGADAAGRPLNARVRPDRRHHDLGSGQNGLSLPPGQARPTLLERPPRHDVLHARAGRGTTRTATATAPSQTPADIERSWARRNEDRLHSFVVSWVYELPFGPEERWLQDGLLSHVLGSWQVSGFFVGSIRLADWVHDEQRNAQGARQHAAPERQRNTERARRHRTERALVRYVSVFGARRRTRGVTWGATACSTVPATSTSTRRWRNASACRAASTATSASTSSTCSTRRISTTRTAISPARTSGGSPARSGSGRCGSG